MIPRRDAIKLAASGLLLPLLAVSSRHSSAQPGSSGVPMREVSVSPTGHMPGPAPSLHAPVAIKWIFQHYGATTGSVIVADGTVFLASDDAHLYAIDAETGIERWRFPIGFESQNTPGYADGKVFTSTSSNIFYALDGKTGQVVWQFTAPEWLDRGDEPFSTFWPQTNVSVFENLVMVSSAITGLHALDATTGQEVWRLPWAKDPKIVGDILITDFVSIAGYDRQSISPLWNLEDDRARTVHAVADGYVAISLGAAGSSMGIAPGSTLEILNPQTGTRIWALDDRPDYLRSVVIADDLVIAEFQSYFDPYREEVLAFDLATGQERWRIEFPDATSTFYTPMVAIEETLYRLRGDSQLVAHDIQTGSELWALPVAVPDNLYFSRPAALDGVLYVAGDHGMLYALANPKPAVLVQEVTLRGAPSTTGIERGTAMAGAEIDQVGERNVSTGQEWIEVTIGDATGWIPLDAIDPATAPPEGEIEYVYIPE